MRNSIKLLITLCSIVLASSCTEETREFEFTGKWQSLNNQPVTIEFTKTGVFRLYRDNYSLWREATQNGDLHIQISPVEKNWYQFVGLDGDEIVIQGKIERVSDKRIRMYYHKQHNILDVADEYYRTSGTQSYSQIMDALNAEEEPQLN